MSAAKENHALPLSRFKVLDLTRVRSGPTAVRQLADWGADVLMIESVGGAGDIAGPRGGSDFQNLHRNKKSLRLDLKREEGRAILLKLVERADVLIENFRPDVKFRLAIDYESLRAINPRLVYASISGFGEDGPYRERPGLDQIAQGMGGLMSVTGLPGQGPVRAGIAVADSAAGLYCALGVMTALLEREVTGTGRWVRTSLLQAQIAMLDFQAARWTMDGVVPPQEGNHHPTAVPMGAFESADGHVNLAAAGAPMFAAFCKAAECERLLSDPRYADSKSRFENRQALRADIAAVIKARPTAHWIEALNAAGVPCGPVYSIDEAFADPQVRHLRMTRRVKSNVRGEMELVAQPITFSDLDFEIRNPAPEAGADADAVLSSLGYSPEAIAKLRAEAII
ncbi:MAG: CaiB/BaiF CoA transferase family protein [Hyphomonadaceae bacterium]